MCTGSYQYVIGSPLFKRAVIKLENGKTVTVEAQNNSPENRYVKGLKVHGNVWNHNYLNYEDLMKGSYISFTMSPVPDRSRGTAEEDKPYSFSRE